MLKYLSIENVAVIKKADIEFFEGFNVLTGETGAGKSILIDSINAVLGERTSKDIIRSGCDTASVTAVFSSVAYCSDKLSSLGIIADENGDLYLQRLLSLKGGSSCRINGSPVPAAVMREVGDLLINVHGQHDNRNLLDPDNHLSYLDKYAGTEPLIKDYHNSYVKLRTVKRELKALEDRLSDAERMRDLYEFQKKDIEQAEIRAGERDELVARRNTIRNARSISEKLNEAVELLSGGENGGAAGAVGEAGTALTSVKNTFEAIGDLDGKLIGFGYELAEIERRLRELLSELDFSESELENVDGRISDIDRVIKKYGGSEESALQYAAKAEKELSVIETASEDTARLEAESEELENEVYEKAQKLTAARKSAADRFAKELCRELGYLMMPDAVVKVNIKEGKYTGTGCDEAEFLLSANPGQEPRPLVKTASGGELSRIMLALKSVLSKTDEVGTSIFDEIDTGISGNAAERVGVKLKDISSVRQVICVTHLAQIASKADAHFLIRKSTDGSTTETAVTRLEGDERVREIARIMSGGRMTEAVHDAARELLERG